MADPYADIKALLSVLGDRLPDEAVEDALDSLSYHEPEPAMAVIADRIYEGGSKLSPDEWQTFAKIAAGIGLDSTRYQSIRPDQDE